MTFLFESFDIKSFTTGFVVLSMMDSFIGVCKTKQLSAPVTAISAIVVSAASTFVVYSLVSAAFAPKSDLSPKKTNN
jgi:hypothetical protein